MFCLDIDENKRNPRRNSSRKPGHGSDRSGLNAVLASQRHENNGTNNSSSLVWQISIHLHLPVIFDPLSVESPRLYIHPSPTHFCIKIATSNITYARDQTACICMYIYIYEGSVQCTRLPLERSIVFLNALCMVDLRLSRVDNRTWPWQ